MICRRCGAPLDARAAACEACGAPGPANLDELARRHELVGPARLWREKRAFQIAFLRTYGSLRPSSTIVDIGCGTLRGGIPIIEYVDAGNYVGVDVREEILDAAHRELEEAGLREKRPTVVVAPSLSEVHLGRRFDVAWAFSVLIHLAHDPLSECLRFVAEHLEPDGVFFANVFLGQRFPGRWRQFPVVWRTLERYEERAALHGLHVDDLGEMRSLGHEFDTLGDEGHMLRITRSGV